MIPTTHEDTQLSPNVINASSHYESRANQHRKPKRQMARRPLVYLTRRLPQAGLDVLLEVCNVKQWDSELVAPKGEILASVVGVDGILCLPGDVIGAEVLDAAGPQLRVVATISYDSKHIDAEECHRKGIQVVTSCLRPTEILAELTIALTLLTIKESQTEQERKIRSGQQSSDVISCSHDNFPEATESRTYVRKPLKEEELSCLWIGGKPRNPESLTWRNIAKMTFGVYGLTKLGKKVGSFLKSIGIFDVLVSDADSDKSLAKGNFSQENGRFVSFDDLLRNSDVVIVCGSESENSSGLFSIESFEKMKKSAILIVPRSHEKVVNYTDLYFALRDGRIKAVGINDCNQRPVPYKSLFMGLSNCTFLPQSQESVHDIRDRVSVDICSSLTEVLNRKRSQPAENWN